MLQRTRRSQLTVKILTTCQLYQFNSTQTPVFCLPFFVSGWGRTVGGGNASEVLQQAVLPIADHLTCRIRNKNLTRVFEGPMLCAGGEGKGGCHVRTMVLSHLNCKTVQSLSLKI